MVNDLTRKTNMQRGYKTGGVPRTKHISEYIKKSYVITLLFLEYQIMRAIIEWYT